jgi:hypothetical protein
MFHLGWIRWRAIAMGILPVLGTFAGMLNSCDSGSAFADDGLFSSSGDVGTVQRPGGVSFDSATNTYSVSGGGKNMWFAEDAFHFVWKEVRGDISLAAEVDLAESPGGDPHRKACLLIRQSLAHDSAYADVALHGDGLTSLQYRPAPGERTYEIQSTVPTTGPRRLRIEKRGNYVSMSIGRADGSYQPAGGTFRLDLEEPYFVGLGVCAHNNDRLEQATFSDVQLVEGSQPPGERLQSTLETISIASKDRRVVWTGPDLIEAPNWTRDGERLIFNQDGRLYSLPVKGGEPQAIDTGSAIACNNDHGISPDGAQLVISDQSQADRQSRIYTLPIAGGVPTLITPNGPAYWHGWSPDGQTLAYCAERNGEYDIYTTPVSGGPETRLTSAKGLDDGPDYSPDGQWLYFNSDRTGSMQIWRMHPDGSGQEQVTDDSYNNWFPHPSPDGRWLVFLSYEPEVEGHPANQDVTLRIVPLAGGEPVVLATLFGGQGTINVPSWSPDSQQLAFVSYQFVP